MFYEVTLYHNSNGFTAGPLVDLGEGWHNESDLLHVASYNGRYAVTEITESDLPEKLNNATYDNLRLFRLDGQYGTSYFAITER